MNLLSCTNSTRHSQLLWIAIIVAVAICSCKRIPVDKMNKTDFSILRDSINELSQPKGATALTASSKHAAYVMLHFWDAMDFADTVHIRNRLAMEQNFVDFFSLFPHADLSAGASAFSVLVTKAAPNPDALRLISAIAEQYLADPNSPMRNEEQYILFLEAYLKIPTLSECERARSAYLLEMAKKNRPGTIATDFKYTDRCGKRNTLHRTSANLLLLVFYDPECSHCSEILETLQKNVAIERMITDKRLSVLALYTEGNRKMWLQTKDTMSQNWNIAIDESNIVDRELYSLPAMPVIYLLDREKRVLLKDVSIVQLVTWLTNNLKS